MYTIIAIEKWIVQFPDLKIVICDGSNFDFTYLVSIFNRPIEFIECLKFQNNSKLIMEYGIGFGEGEIIKYAIENSKILANAESFVKCTAKLWLINPDYIFNKKNKKLYANFGFSSITNLLLFKPNYMDTRIYFVNKNYYINNFLHAYQGVQKKYNINMEEIMAIHCKKCDFREIEIINNYPLFQGLSGSSAHNYSETKNIIIKERLKHFIKLVFAGLLIRIV